MHIVLLLTASLFADELVNPEPPENVKRWVEKLEAAKAARLKTAERKVRESKNGLLNASTPDEKRKILRQTKDDAERLKKATESKLNPNDAALGTSPEVGDIGYLRHGKVLRIIDATSAVVEIDHNVDYVSATGRRSVINNRRLAVVRGLVTEKMITDRSVTFDRVYEAKEIATVAGMRIIALEPFDTAKWSRLYTFRKPEPIVKKRPWTPKVAVPPEIEAAERLKQAKGLLGVNDFGARMRLKEIVDKFPDMVAAQEAAKLLEK